MHQLNGQPRPEPSPEGLSLREYVHQAKDQLEESFEIGDARVCQLEALRSIAASLIVQNAVIEQLSVQVHQLAQIGAAQLEETRRQHEAKLGLHIERSPGYRT